MKQPDTQLQRAVEEAFKCEARFLESVHVTETFQGQLVWTGDVAVFAIGHHPTGATRAYGWAYCNLEGDCGPAYITVIGIDPIKQPLDAVRVAILAGNS